MTKKEKVIGLFEFLMDLLEDNQIENSLPKEDSKVLEPTPPTTKLNVNTSLALMKKISEIDKDKANERSKIKAINNATRPLIQELETLKEMAHKNALSEKEKEENEDGVNVGLTLVDGKPNVVSIPSKLRDNIPLSETDLVGLSTYNNIPIAKSDLKIEISAPLKTKQSKKVRPKKPVIKKSTTKKTKFKK